MKKIFIAVIMVVLGLMLFSCGDTPSLECSSHTDKNLDKKCDVCGADMTPVHTEHTDSDKDGKCDVCGKIFEINNDFADVALIEDGKPVFRFVLASGVSGDARYVFQSYIDEIRYAGSVIEVVNDKNEDYPKTEVLIGGVTGRSDKYVIDKHSLGKEGFALTAIDNKVIIEGGTSDALVTAIEFFFENVLGIYVGVDNELCDAVFTKDDEMIEIQDNYAISDIQIAGSSVRGKTIAVDKKDYLTRNLANVLQDALYTFSGIYLEIIPIEEKKEDSIVIANAPDDGEWGFKVYTEGKSLNVECAYTNAFEKAFNEFVTKEVKLANGVLSFGSDYLYTKNVRIVHYEDFGAVGDGDADDFFAIKEAHDYANKCGQTVVGTPGKTYRIHNIVDSYGNANRVIIKTNVDWTKVKFIIDDTGYTKNDANNNGIFSVSSDYSILTVTDREIIEKIFSGHTVDKDFTGYLNWSDYGYEALVTVVNSTHKNYIRYGGNANDGGDQSELIVVGADGKIRDDTPFMFDYADITKIQIRRIDEKPITIKGGEFTTIANDTPQTKDDWGYFSRNFSVSRSYTTVDGLRHYIKGELPGLNISSNTDPKGPPYSGFFSVSGCSDVTYKNGVLTGRRSSGIAGTYDFGAGTANNLTLYNVIQSNYYMEDGVTPSMDYKHYWGIGGTNYCKNLTYDSCVLSRFDAHCGLYNGKVINSTITNFELIGAGDFLIENTVITPVSNTPIMLRGDYGYTWRGTLTLKDVTVRWAKEGKPVLISAGWVNHYFGYTCYFPNIEIDNLKWEGLSGNEIWLTGFASDDYLSEDKLFDGSPNNNYYIAPKFLTVKNCNGLKIDLKGSGFFVRTNLSGLEMIYDY